MSTVAEAWFFILTEPVVFRFCVIITHQNTLDDYICCFHSFAFLKSCCRFGFFVIWASCCCCPLLGHSRNRAHLSIKCLCTAPQIKTPSASNQDTYLYLSHSNSSVHLTTTCMRPTGRITSGMCSEWKPHKSPHFYPQHQHTPARSNLHKQSLGLV